MTLHIFWLTVLTKITLYFFSSFFPTSAQVNWDSPETLQSKDSVVSTATGRAVAVTANPLASDAALKILERGGTAMDAVVAAQAVLTVVEPQSSGLGGGSFLLYWDEQKKFLYALDGRETAPSRAGKDDWLNEDGTPLSWIKATKSLSAIGVPGTTALLWEGHGRFGRLPWNENFEESIRIAEQGFLPSPRFLSSIFLAKRIGINHSDAFKSLYLPNGDLPNKNIPFQNKALARTLTRIADLGVEEFYRGNIAKDLLIDLNKYQLDGANVRTMTLNDLANYQIYERNPICRPYRKWRVCTFPPPSGGGIALLQTLGIFEILMPRNNEKKNVFSWHYLAESLRLADADRSHWIGDPIDWPVPVDGLLEDSYIKERAAFIKPNKAHLSPLPGTPRGSELLDLASQPRTSGGGTTHLVIVDIYGNIASYTGSVETVFGSRYISGGMILNNQLTDFSFVPSIGGKSISNRVGPKKRPMSSMSPVIVFSGNRPVIAIGSPGGWVIPHFLSNAIIKLLDLGLPPKEAVETSHLSVRPTETILEKNAFWFKDQLDIVKKLELLGHRVKTRSFSSGLALIQLRDGLWHGAADPRREGKAVGLQ